MSRAESYRRAMLGKIHIAQSRLKLGDDAYRAILERVTGKRSAGEMTLAELDAVINELRRLGFKPAGKRGTTARPAADKRAMMGKIGAILKDLDLHWNYAHGMAKRMVNKENLAFCTPEELKKVMQALIIHQKRIKT